MGKALLHLALGKESLDDTQSAQGLIELCQQRAPVVLCLLGLALELTADGAHHPSQGRHSHEHEERELPTEEEEGEQRHDDGDGVLDEHLQRVGERGLQSTHVATHAGYDVALALLGEEAERQSHYLIIYLYADVAHHACAQRYQRSCRAEVAGSLEQRHHNQYHSRGHEYPQCTACLDEGVHVIVEVVLDDIGYVAVGKGHVLVLRVAHLKENLQDRDEQGKGEHVEYLCQQVEREVTEQELLIGRYEPTDE